MRHEPEVLAKYLKRYASHVLLLGARGESYKYSEILQMGAIGAFATTCRNLVFCIVDNDINGLAGYLALLTANAVPLMLGTGISSSQLHNLVTSYNPRYIWLPDARMEEIAGALCLESFRGYCLIDRRNSPTEIHESLALLLGTSGSTGSPKFVRLSHKNLLSNAQSIAGYLGLSPQELPITTLPPSYSYGLSIIHSHILVGATIAVTNRTFFDRGFWDFIREVKATSFGGVPYHYEILKKLRFTRMVLPSLRTLTQAGGRMEPSLTAEYALHCHNHGMRFFTMYGQAEATARMSYLPTNKSSSKAGSIGNAIPGGRFWLEDEQGRVIDEADTTGQLVYEGSNVFMGYAYGCEDLAKGDEINGVLHTGDVAKRDADGDYYIVGRLKRFIKLFGYRVNLLDVEKYLIAAGHTAACAGQDDCLEVYTPNPSEEAALQIKTMLTEYLKVAPIGIAVYGIPALPRNESGKIQYTDLRPQIATLIA